MEIPSPATQAWPPMAVLRLDVKKPGSSTSVPGPGGKASVNRILQRVVKSYQSTCAKVQGTQFSRIKCGSWNRAKCHNFQCVGYRRTFVKPDAIGQFFGAYEHKEKPRSLMDEYLLFFTRIRKVGRAGKVAYDLFAASTEEHIVRGLKTFCDENFSRRISAKLCAPFYTHARYRPIAGTTHWREEAKEKGNLADLDHSEVLEVTRPIRCDELPSRVKVSVKQMMEGVELTLWPHAVRFNRHLLPSQLCSLLDTYSRCMRSRQFAVLADPSRSIESWRGVQKLVKVPHQASQALIRELWDALQRGYPYPTDLRFSPPQVAPMELMLGQCSLEFGGKSYPLSGQKTASTVLQRLWEELPDRGTIKRIAFANVLKSAKVTFRNLSGTMRHSLLSCFSGLVIVPKLGFQHYYQGEGSWYTVRKDAVKQLFMDFQRVMAECLVDEFHEAYLQRVWAEGDDEEKYNDLYGRDSEFLVGDKACVCGVHGKDGVELFDLLHWVEDGNLYPCQVKKRANRGLRHAVLQIYHAAKVLRGAYDNPHTTLFEDFGKSLHGANRRAHNRFFLEGGAKWLKQQFQKRSLSQIVFVLACTSSGDLRQELLGHRHLGKQELEFLVSTVDLDVSERDVLVALQKSGFVGANRALTFKLFNALSYEDAELFCKEFTTAYWAKKDKRRLYAGLKQIMGTNVESLNALFSIVELAKWLEELGFGFKICQIPSTGSDRDVEVVGGSIRKPLHRCGNVISFAGSSYEIKETHDEGISALHAAGKWDRTSRWYCWNPGRTRAQRCQRFVGLITRRLGHELIEHLLCKEVTGEMDSSQKDRSILQQRRLLAYARSVSTSNQTRFQRAFLKQKYKTQGGDKFVKYFSTAPPKKGLNELLSAVSGRIVPNVKKEKERVYDEYNEDEDKLRAAYEKHNWAVRQWVIRNGRSQDRPLQHVFNVMEERSGSLLELYLSALESPDYRYGWLELTLFAKAHDMQIQVLSAKKGGGYRAQMVLDEDKESFITLFYEENTGRYARCEKLSKTSAKVAHHSS